MSAKTNRRSGPSARAETPRTGAERREISRGRLRMLADPIYRTIRKLLDRAHGFGTAVGIVLVVGFVLASALAVAFGALAREVRAGKTQMFDEGVMAYLGAHRIDWVQASLVEITNLGTGLVIMMIVGVAALLLWNTRHRYSALLLLVSAGGGLVLNGLLKLGFDRERPHMFDWATHASSSSFPSGHAMSSATVYTTIAYLAARLQRHWWAKLLTAATAVVLIVIICLSRLYLGVHYPSDVLAGVIMGVAWAAFCMAMLEVIQALGRRRADVRRHERPADEEKGEAPPTTAEGGKVSHAAAAAADARSGT